MLLSIILPTYNVEPWIKRCILSIVKQGLVQNEYEIIVVNDESPDNSPTIVAEMQLNYPEIRLINQKNKGLSGARNTGIRHASGKYLLFVDPDDYLEPFCLQQMITFMEDLQLELGMFNQNLIKNRKSLSRTTPNLQENKVSSGPDVYHSRTSDSACKYLLNTEFIKKNNLYFYEEAVYLEDAEWSARVFATLNRASYRNIFFYNYDLRESSLVTSGVGLTWPAVKGYVKCAESLQDFRNNCGLSAERKQFVNNVIAKFVVLPFTMYAGKRRLKSLPKLISLMQAAGFGKLPTLGLIGLRKRQVGRYNISPYYFFLTCILDNLRKSVTQRLAAR